MDGKELGALLARIDGGVASLATKHTELSQSVKTFDERFTQMDTRVQSLEEKLKQRATGLPGAEEVAEQFSLRRALLMISTRDWTNPEFALEAEVIRGCNSKGEKQARFDKGSQRDLTTSVDSLGGYLVPAQVLGQFIDLLRARMVLSALGATVLTGLTGSPVEIPGQSGGATGYWVGEGSTITSSDQAFRQIALVPHEAAAITFVSNRTLKLSSPGVEAIVRDDLAKVLARQIDVAGLQGTGAAGQPQGIVNVSGVNTTSISGVPDVDDLYNMMYELEVDNADDGALGWAFHPRTWNTLRQVKDGSGNYILTTAPTPGNVVGTVRSPVKGTLLGYPFATTTQISITLGAGSNASRIIHGNYADLLMGLWGGVEILASQEAGNAFERNQTYIRIVQLVDVAVRHAEWFDVGGARLA